MNPQDRDTPNRREKLREQEEQIKTIIRNQRIQLLSPTQVVEKMAFTKEPREELEPDARPPAAPPPPLPYSYQHSTLPAAPMPTITHFDNDPKPSVVRSWVRGDASIRPNIGETNSYDYALCGLALHELLEQLRLANIVACTFSILSLLFTWLIRAITLQWSKLVLEIYLAVFACLLLVNELMSIWRIDWIENFIRDQFGILHRPVGKACFLLLLGTVCFGIGGFKYIVGLVYFGSGGFLLAAYFMYSDLRERDVETPVAQERPMQHMSWSYFSTSLSSMLTKEDNEIAPLVSQSLRQHSTL